MTYYILIIIMVHSYHFGLFRSSNSKWVRYMFDHYASQGLKFVEVCGYCSTVLFFKIKM